MSEEKKTEKKLGLADMLGEAGIDGSAIGLSKSGIRAGVAFGVKAPINEALIALARKEGVKSAWAVADKKFRSKLPKKVQEEYKKKRVIVVDWKSARRACNAEVARMQKNLGSKPRVIDAEIAAEYGVYRTNAEGQFVVCQKLTQGRRPQMIGVVNKLAKQLDADGVDYFDAGNDKDGPVLVIEA
jgi:hypothetical protein